jgi:NADH-quinone oxidoreductase subunit I
MAINVRVMKRPERTSSYLRASLRGMALTFRHLVNPQKVTIEYPDRAGAAPT